MVRNNIRIISEIVLIDINSVIRILKILLIILCFQLLNDTTELTENALESSLSSISSIVNNSITSSNDNDVAHNDIIQSVDLISTISDKTVNFTNQDSANKTTQVMLISLNIYSRSHDKRLYATKGG